MMGEQDFFLGRFFGALEGLSRTEWKEQDQPNLAVALKSRGESGISRADLFFCSLTPGG